MEQTTQGVNKQGAVRPGRAAPTVSAHLLQLG